MSAIQLQPHESLLVLPDAPAAAQAAAEHVVKMFSGVACDAERSVALAGGRTPAAMYRLLTQSPWRERVDWARINWFWGDERCVPPDHPDSNYRMAMETLLTPLGVPSSRIHRMPADAPDRDAAARDYEATIRRIVPADADNVPQLDLILLGIGADGHTASLFPGSSGLAGRQRLVVAHHAPAPNAMRMTLTYPLLWHAKHILFLTCGADKSQAVRRIFTQPVEDAPPAASVRYARGSILWLLDHASAALLA
jgi:6-phosphogluconolactonase